MKRLESAAPLLWNHNSDELIGVIEGSELDAEARKLRARVRFGNSDRARQVLADVRDGIIQNVSIGYRVHELVLESKQEGVETYRATRWEPYEVSFVSVPADISVGVGRAVEPAATAQGGAEIINQKKEKSKMNDKVIPLSDDSRAAEIRALGQRHGVESEWAVENGLNVDQYRGYVLNQIAVAGKAIQMDAPPVTLTEKEQKRWSLFNAILSLQNKTNSFEREVSTEIAKVIGRVPNGIFMPYDVPMRRDLTVDGTGTGAELVGTDHRADLFIDVLTNKMLATQLGVNILTGLRGNVSIPKLTAGSTYGWAATETGALSESTPTTAQVTLTPKRGGTYVDVSKQEIVQANTSVEALVMKDLARAAALGIDYAIFLGPGASGSPAGVIGSATNVTGTSLDYAGALSFISNVMAANADVSSMQWVTSPEIWATLSSREKVTGYPAFLIDEATQKMCGYKMNVSQQMYDESNKYIEFGDWSQVLVGFWGAADILIDPYTQATSGLERIVIQQYADVAVRYGAAFSKTSNFS